MVYTQCRLRGFIYCSTNSSIFVEGTRPNVDEELCQKQCLKIGDIDPNTFTTVYKRLDMTNARGHDWRGLAGRLGYTVNDVLVRKQFFFLNNDKFFFSFGSVPE